MNHQEVVTQAQAAAIKAQEDAANAEGLYRVYAAHPEIRVCDANTFAITKYFNGDQITLADFDQGYQHESVRKSMGLAMQSEQERRDHLEKQNFKLLPNMSPDARENLHAQFAAKMPQQGLGVFDEQAGSWLVKTESMELQLRNLQTGKKYEGFSTEQLTEEVKTKRTIVGDFAPLPSTITKFQLRMMSVADLKKTIQKFGVQQINQRLAETA